MIGGAGGANNRILSIKEVWRAGDTAGSSKRAACCVYSAVPGAWHQHGKLARQLQLRSAAVSQSVQGENLAKENRYHLFQKTGDIKNVLYYVPYYTHYKHFRVKDNIFSDNR